MSGVLHLLFNIYTSISTLGSGQGGMLVFSTYLLMSGHIRGHGCGHFGHGGQYTDLGQPLLVERFVFLDGEPCATIMTLLDTTESLSASFITRLTVSFTGELLTTRMHFFTGFTEQLDTNVSLGGCINVHMLSPINTPRTTTRKEINIHDFITFESNMIFSVIFYII